MHLCLIIIFGKVSGGDLWMSYGSNPAAGVAILKGTFKGKIIQTNIHDSGRYSGDIGNRKEY